MNNDTGGNRRLRHAGILAVMAAVAVLAAACGSTSSSSAASSASGESAAYRQALAFSKCMRAHGEPDYPDPNASGTIALPSAMNPNSSQMQAAQNACRHLLPDGGVTSPGQAQQNLALELRLSRCMRTHGVPNFPDPSANGQGSASGGLSKGAQKSPQFQAAMRTCRSLVHAPAKAGRR